MRIIRAGMTGAELQTEAESICSALNNTTHYGQLRIARTQVDGNAFIFLPGVESASAVGAAHDARGKAKDSACACWHVHRDMAFAMFAAHPTLRLRWGAKRFHGRPQFLDAFLDTGLVGCGSGARPNQPYKMCGCNLGLEEYGCGVEDALHKLWRFNV